MLPGTLTAHPIRTKSEHAQPRGSLGRCDVVGQISWGVAGSAFAGVIFV